MRRTGYLFPFLLVFLLACGTLASPAQKTVNPAELKNSALVDAYDPHRDPAEDLKQAIIVAQQEKKRIMLELGGDWCIWCKHMDDFYQVHKELLQFRAEHYVLVKVNVSQENMNETFLSQFPAAAGYPHIYILEGDGMFLHSQNTAELEDGADSYVLEVFMNFLQTWALPAQSSPAALFSPRVLEFHSDLCYTTESSTGKEVRPHENYPKE